METGLKLARISIIRSKSKNKSVKKRGTLNKVHLKVICFNARSIINKLTLLHNFLVNNDSIDLIFITESWLTTAKFYSYAKNKLNFRPEIPPLRKHNQLGVTDTEKADTLNSMFHNVYKVDDGNDLNLFCKVLSQQCMNDVTVDFYDVARAIQMIPDKLSQSPDGIPAYFLKRVASPILDILLHLFNLSLNLGVIPSQWRSAIIVPIHKKGSRDLPCNYRPISLT